MSIKIGKSWSKKEDRYLIDNFKDMNRHELAEKLNRTPGAVSARLCKLRSENAIFGYSKKKPKAPNWWERRAHNRKWV